MEGEKFDKKELIYDLISLLLLSAGTVLVIQPDFIFGESPKLTYNSLCNPNRFYHLEAMLLKNVSNETIPIDSVHVSIYKGYLFIVGVGIVNTLNIIVGKYLIVIRPLDIRDQYYTESV